MDSIITLFKVCFVTILILYTALFAYSYFKGTIFLATLNPFTMFLIASCIVSILSDFLGNPRMPITLLLLILILSVECDSLLILNDNLFFQFCKINLSSIEEFVITKTESKYTLKITTDKKTILPTSPCNEEGINKLKALLTSRNIPFQLKEAKANA